MSTNTESDTDDDDEGRHKHDEQNPPKAKKRRRVEPDYDDSRPVITNIVTAVANGVPSSFDVRPWIRGLNKKKARYALHLMQTRLIDLQAKSNANAKGIDDIGAALSITNPRKKAVNRAPFVRLILDRIRGNPLPPPTESAPFSKEWTELAIGQASLKLEQKHLEERTKWNEAKLDLTFRLNTAQSELDALRNRSSLRPPSATPRRVGPKEVSNLLSDASSSIHAK